jgi:organic solute transporter subunit alpha
MADVVVAHRSGVGDSDDFGLDNGNTTLTSIIDVSLSYYDVDVCDDTAMPPTAADLFKNLSTFGYVLVASLVVNVLLTIAVYAEEVFFILKHFERGERRNRTIWILAFFPVFSVFGFVGVVVPRAGTLVDMVSNVFFCTCLYNFGYLILDYLGGQDRMWRLVGGTGRTMKLNTPPCCCCCVCLPAVPFDKRRYFNITICVMQVTIVRPILMFIAAVLWTNGTYNPGTMASDDAYGYITSANILSTLVAFYGLTVWRVALRPELEEQFRVTGKLVSLQLTLLSSAIPSIIIAILVSTGVIGCTTVFPSKARGEAINSALLVMLMLPFSLLGRIFYRRESDGSGVATGTGSVPTATSTDVEMAELKQPA